MRTSSACRTLRGVTCSLLLAIGACGQTNDEMSWARTALERNDQLEIVAEDPETRTFTVRVKESNELQVVRADELAAAVPQAKPASASTQTAPAAPAPGVEMPPADSAAANAAAPDAPPPAADRGDEVPESAAGAEAPSAPVTPAAGNARVIASGPGYSIQAGDRDAPSAARPGGETPSAAATERRTEPLVCQGSRFMHIDGRSITFTGDALVAEDGCELHITNSHITAAGVGLAVRGASVHIRNSTVAGESGAIQASGNSQIYTRSSRFRGMVRRLDDAVLHDMGQNVWN